MVDLDWILATVLVLVVVAVGGRYATRRHVAAQRNKYGFDTVGELRLLDLPGEIEAEETWARGEHTRLSDRILALRNPTYESMTPYEVVALSAKEEIEALQEITGEASIEPAAQVDALRDIGSNTLAQIFRMFSSTKDTNVSYEEIVRDACKHLGLRDPRGPDIYSLEVLLQRHAFTKVLESMPEEQRQRFLMEFATQSLDPGLRKEALVGGGLVVANLSGFGLYLASSTALGAITSAIGVTLPFAIYTGMSSTMAVLIGPVGWVALGAWMVHKLGRPDPNKVIAGTLMIANIRQRLIAVRDEPLPLIRHDRDVVLRDFQMTLKNLREKWQRAKNYSVSETETVRRGSYSLPARPDLYR